MHHKTSYVFAFLCCTFFQSFAQETHQICGSQYFEYCFFAGEEKEWLFQAPDDGALRITIIDHPRDGQVHIDNVSLNGNTASYLYAGNGRDVELESYFYHYSVPDPNGTNPFIEEDIIYYTYPPVNSGYDGNIGFSLPSDLYLKVINSNSSSCSNNSGSTYYPVKFLVEIIPPIYIATQTHPANANGVGTIQLGSFSSSSGEIFNLDGGNWQTSVSFSNITPGKHTIGYQNATCTTTSYFEFYMNPSDHPDVARVEIENAVIDPNTNRGSIKVFQGDGSMITEFDNYYIRDLSTGIIANGNNLEGLKTYSIETFDFATGGGQLVLYNSYLVGTDYYYFTYNETDCQAQTFGLNPGIANSPNYAEFTFSVDGEIVASGNSPSVFDAGDYPLDEEISLQININNPVDLENYQVVRSTSGTACARICQTENFSYCYENNETKEWHYQSTSGQPLNIYFTSGTLTNGDVLRIYDGEHAGTSLLFESIGTTLTSTYLVTTNPDGKLFMTLTSDATGSCAQPNGNNYHTWEWQVKEHFTGYTISLSQPDCTNDLDGRISFNSAFDLGYQYSINEGITWQDNHQFFDLPEGNYQIAIRNFSDDGSLYCASDLTTVTLEDTNLPSIEDLNIIEPMDCESSDGLLQVVATGNNLQYSITNGNNYQTQASFSNLSADDYSIYVRDQNNPTCFVVENFSLYANERPIITGSTVFKPTSCNNSDGVVQLTTSAPSGMILIYSYNNGSTWQGSPIFSNLSKGSYIFRTRDANNEDCFSEPYMLTINDLRYPENTSFDIYGASSCVGDDGSIEFLNVDASSYSFSIDNGNEYDSNPFFDNLSSGFYKTWIQHNNSQCEYEIGGILLLGTPTDPAAMAVSFTQPTDNCGSQDGRIDFQIEGSTIDKLYSIDNGSTFQSSPNFENLAPGTYICGVSDAGGNCFNYTNSLEVKPKYVLEVTTGSFADCTSQTFFAEISVEDFRGDYLYLYDNQGNNKLVYPDTENGIDDQITFGPYTVGESVIFQLFHPNAQNCNTEFTATAPCALAALAVTLEGTKLEMGNRLEWGEVINQASAIGFLLEKSENGIDFVNLAAINIEGDKRYQVLDSDPATKTFYKLWLKEEDGKLLQLDQLIMVRDEVLDVKIYPNPALKEVFIELPKAPKEKYTILLYNALGKALREQQTKNPIHQFYLTDLTAGVYFLEIERAGIVQIEKLIIK